MGFLDAIDRSVATVTKGLDARAQRQAVIAANIANADTPGYRALDVSFAELLEQASAAQSLTTTNPMHLQPGAAGGAGSATVVFSGSSPRRDGNDVNVDREMVTLARTQIEYQFLARALSRRFGKFREAITGRAQ